MTLYQNVPKETITFDIRVCINHIVTEQYLHQFHLKDPQPARINGANNAHETLRITLQRGP